MGVGRPCGEAGRRPSTGPSGEELSSGPKDVPRPASRPATPAGDCLPPCCCGCNIHGLSALPLLVSSPQPPTWCQPPPLWAPRQHVHDSVVVSPGLAHWFLELSTRGQPKCGPESQQAWRQSSPGDGQAGGHRKSGTGTEGKGRVRTRGETASWPVGEKAGGISVGERLDPFPSGWDSPIRHPHLRSWHMDGRRGSDSRLSSRPASFPIPK